MGRQAYAELREDLPLPERILLFERIVEEALQAYRHQHLALHLHCSEHDAAERAHHRELLTALVPDWERAVEVIEELLPDVEDEGIASALQTAAKQVRSMTRSGRDGNAGWTATAMDGARESLGEAAVGFESRGRGYDASRCRALANDLPRRWPSTAAMGNVVTKHLTRSVEAGERTQDLQAIARWVAPVIGQECVEAGLDPTVLREVGNTLSSAGGGIPHLSKLWPEQRARIQVLADQAASLGTKGDQQIPQHGPVFEWVLVRGERYEFFTDRQRHAVKVLWEAQGRPVHEDAIRDALGAEDCDRFRMDHTFRHKGRPIPAWGTIIVRAEAGSRTYRLVR